MREKYINFMESLKTLPVYYKVIIFIGIILLLLIYIFMYRAPGSFPVDTIIQIEEGETLNSVTIQLKDEGVIRSKFLFKSLSLVLGGKVLSGDYYLEKKRGVFSIAYRIVNGKFDLELTPVLIPEGFTSFQIADRLKDTFLSFDKEKFVVLAKENEGYLFPETYYFPQNITPEEVVLEMTKTFRKKTADLNISNEELIMASLIEREARLLKTKKMIAGILWNRIDIGMALQVDAVFGYIHGVPTFNPTFDDLKFDSPYNTYKYRGLPPGPISNPGIDSILATLHPTKSKYLFYLTDSEGNMHYSEDFEGHVENKRLYLR